MNKTQLKACFTSLNFRAQLHGAMVKTAKLKHNTAHIKNRNGKAFLGVRYNSLTGFNILDSKGRNITATTIELLRATN